MVNKDVYINITAPVGEGLHSPSVFYSGVTNSMCHMCRMSYDIWETRSVARSWLKSTRPVGRWRRHQRRMI